MLKDFKAFYSWWIKAGCPGCKKAIKMLVDDPTNLSTGDIRAMIHNCKVNKQVVQAKTARELIDKRKERIAKEAEKQDKLEEREVNKKYSDVNILLSATEQQGRGLSKDEKKLINIINENKELKKINKRLVNEISLDDKVVSVFENVVEPFEFTQFIDPPKRHKSLGKNETLIHPIADPHIGENILSYEVQNLNEYNIEILKERLNTLFQSFYSILNNRMTTYAYDRIIIPLMGDMVPGLIHAELKETSEPIAESVTIAAYSIANYIIKIASMFPDTEIDVIGVVGNHGRLSEKVSYKKIWNNFDYFVYQLIKALCVNYPNIKFAIPKSFNHIEQVYDFNFDFRHGDERVQFFANLPYYGITRLVNNESMLQAFCNDTLVQYYVLGHYHQYVKLPKTGGDITICPSLIGMSEFSIKKGFSSSKPEALLFSVHPEHGKTWEFKLTC